MILCQSLGPPVVRLADGSVPAILQWRKNLALLVYLARSPLLGGRKSGGQKRGHANGKPRKSNAPRRTRTPSLLIRSHANGDSERHAATRAVIPRRTGPTVYRNRRAASRPGRSTPTFTSTLLR